MPRSLRAGDDICNGATDNAAGVARPLRVPAPARSDTRRNTRAVARSSSRSGTVRQDGLLGSAVLHPAPARAARRKTVAYVNLDIQGANLRPSLRNLSFAIGAETGGGALQQIVQSAIDPAALGTRRAEHDLRPGSQ